jgi:type IV pilus assembly protein PilY1
MNPTRIFGFLATALVTFGVTAHAEDIDLFVQPGGDEADVPNVLILLDNTANWSRTVNGQAIYINEIDALVSTLDSLATNADGSARFRVGLMLFTETGNPNNNVDGGYVRAAVRDMTETNKALYMDLLESLDENDDKSNGGKAGKTFSEAYQYFAGLAPYSGNRKEKTDYDGNTSGTVASNAIYDLDGNAIDSFNGTPYNSPVDPDYCSRNYIIYISNGAAQDNTSDNRTATDQLAVAATAEGISGATTQIPISPAGSTGNVANEWARFMYRSDERIVTYTVDVDRISTGQGPGWTALLESIARVSSGEYFSVTSGNGGAEIADALGVIFSEIQAVNSVFASVSLPLSINSQGTYLNQVYVGVFRPDEDALPRWYGNLKQYKLGLVNNELRLLDANDAAAINSQTGFITECARSFWSTADTYWSFRPQGGCIGANDASNSPDGNIVEKGAQAQKLRSSTTRNLKTCTTASFACTGGLVNFNNSNVSQANVLAADTTEQDALINWQRGLDVDDEDINSNGSDGVTSSEMRASAHGDVVHSRPVAINYRTNAEPEVVVFYSGNDGVLRAINGNRDGGRTMDSAGPGAEMWSFVPPEFFGQVKRLRDNDTQINYLGNSTTSPMPLPKPYGLDGSITAYTDIDDKWVYVTARRGGRVVYAFDMTTLHTDRTSPSLLWKIGCANPVPNPGAADACTGAFSQIGQTWSAVKPIATSYSPSMLIMGGGYDPCEDEDPISDTCRSSSKGNRVYVMNAETGAVLKTFNTDRGVAADVFVVPDQTTGLAVYAYAVDLGGNIYRISGSTANLPFGSTDPASWTMTKIASLGCDTTALCTPNRKFMFAPDVVEDGGTYFILVGSGDREKPLLGFDSAADVTNHFFMVKDVPTSTTWLTSEITGGGACGSAVMCLNSLLEIPLDGDDPDDADLASHKGWYLGLHDTEQVVTAPITVFGTTTFSTHTPTVPDAGTCESDLGTARVYNLRFLDATSRNGTDNRYEVIVGGGLPPSPVAGEVILDGSSEPIPFIIGADPDSPLEGRQPIGPPSSAQPKSLTYWFIEK